MEAARAAGLDTTSVFRKQQEKCRTELVESYLIDRQVMDSCARAIYQKMGLKARSGRVQVMQIFKRLPQTITSRHLEEEKTRMDSIYRMISKVDGSNVWKQRASLRMLLSLWQKVWHRSPFSLLKGFIS